MKTEKSDSAKVSGKAPTGRGQFIPETPGGSVLMHLAARTEEKAWANLLREAAHMPYQGIEGFKQRGYKVERWTAA